MRIDKYLSHAGLGTRTEVKKIIRKEEVLINGKQIFTESAIVNEEEDVVTVNGEEINYHEFYYILLNKPQGYVSATEDAKYPTVIDLVDEYRFANLFPVGRLDIDTTGLLLLSNNGKLSHYLLSPRHHVDKEYVVELNYPLKEELIEKFKKGIYIEEDDYTTLPAELIITDETHAHVIIKEGKFHQIKRMFKAFGYTVMNLQRIRMDKLILGELPLGQYRILNKEEIESLLLNMKE